MALIAQLGEHCTGIAEVVGSNPAQSLKIFSGLCSSSVTAALALITVITQLLLWDKLLSLLSLVLKLTTIALQRSEADRVLFRSDVCLLDPEMLVFLDESGFVSVYLPSNTSFRSLVYYYLALIVQWSQFNFFF